MAILLAACALQSGIASADFAADKATFDANMIEYGEQHCDTLLEHVYDNDHVLATYYDGERVYYQIRDYTQDASWNACAQASEWVYRDHYMLEPGGPAGYFNFGRGLALDYERTGDVASLAALEYLVEEALYCRGSASEIAELPNNELSRENAYCVLSFIDAQRLGIETPRLALYVDFALGHVQQWLTHSSPLQPFMAALTAEALTTYHDWVHAESSLPPLIGQLAHELWTMWDSPSQSFLYDNHDGTFDPSADLNLLIAPVFAWAYARLGDDWYRARFEQIFAGGVHGAFLGGSGKQFNQNYRWSIQALGWLSAISGPAGSVAGLTVAKAGAADLTLHWNPSCSTVDTDYEIHVGQLGAWQSHAPYACTTDGATSILVTPPATAAYYLVVPRNGSQEGSYGTSTAGERPSSSTACRAQLVADCP